MIESNGAIPKLDYQYFLPNKNNITDNQTFHFFLDFVSTLTRKDVHVA